MSDNVYTVEAFASILKRQTGSAVWEGLEDEQIVNLWLGNHPEHIKNIDPEFLRPAADPGSLSTKLEAGFHGMKETLQMGGGNIFSAIISPDTWFGNKEKSLLANIERNKQHLISEGFDPDNTDDMRGLAAVYQNKVNEYTSKGISEEKARFYADAGGKKYKMAWEMLNSETDLAEAKILEI